MAARPSTRVLVTGGAGYIGSITAGLLRERGDQVVVLDSLERGCREAVAGAPLVVGDTRDEDLVRRVLREYGIEAVVHLAAYKAVGESMQSPGKYFDNNVQGSLRLLEAMRHEGVSRMVFSSTAAVYGTPRVARVTEDSELDPQSPYGESKLMVERLLRWYDEAHGIRHAVLRYFNAAGAMLDGSNGEDPRRVHNLIPVVMNVATGRSRAVQVFGSDYDTPDGTALRDYIHVLDLAEAHLRALDFITTHDRSDVFNLGTGTCVSVKAVIDAASRVSGIAIPVEWAARRPGDPMIVCADNQKATAQLGWRPRFGLDDIIASAWTWHSTHPDGLAGETQRE